MVAPRQADTGPLAAISRNKKAIALENKRVIEWPKGHPALGRDRRLRGDCVKVNWAEE